MVGGIIAIARIKVSHELVIKMDVKAGFVNKEVPENARHNSNRSD